jgi:Fic family protein
VNPGTYIRQPSGYSAFVPAPLPSAPKVAFDEMLFERALVALGRLDGFAHRLPNPDLFLSLYVRHEAVLSSQIEGTRSTVDDLLVFEAGQPYRGVPDDVQEVANYVRALNHGLARLREGFPMSLRLIREVHRELMHGVRGQHSDPGEFRRTQNWIGPPGATLATATFVPPPVHEMERALSDLEDFLHDEGGSSLVATGLAHAQLETIHPFLDGNGRLGRLLIALQLCDRGLLREPLLYLSRFFSANRSEYYARLGAIRESGDWAGWMDFFLRGVASESVDAFEKAERIVGLREDVLASSSGEVEMTDLIFARPILTIRAVEEALDVVYNTAAKLVRQFEQLGYLDEITGQRRNRLYRFGPYLDLFR